MEIESEFIHQENLLICRCCMKSENSMENMFEVALSTMDNPELSLADILNSITEMNYSAEDDGMTPFVCSTCYQVILDYQNFKSQCRETDTFLRAQNAAEKIENIVEFEEIVEFERGPSLIREEAVYEELLVEQVEYFGANESIENVYDVVAEPFHDKKQLVEEKLTRFDHKRRHQCSICSKRFESPAKVRRHLHVHKDVLKTEDLPERRKIYLNYTCDICRKKIETPSKLERHMRVHDKNSKLYSGANTRRPFGCTKCQMRFWDQMKLEKHQVVHSDALEKSKIQHSADHLFICVLCNQRQKNFDDLMDHMKSHSEECAGKSNIQCRLCSNTYSSLSNVIRHSKCHTENATHKCIYCGKLMGYSEDFLKHLLRHQNFKPFECNKCDRSFTVLQKFNQHQLKHTKDLIKIFQCDHCEKKFSNLDYLENHLTSHCEESNFK